MIADLPVIEIRLSAEDVKKVCRTMGAQSGAIACQTFGFGNCYIIIPDYDKGLLRQHELDHCSCGEDKECHNDNDRRFKWHGHLK